MTAFSQSFRSSEAPHHERHSSSRGFERSSSNRDPERPSHQQRHSRIGRANTATAAPSQDPFSRLAATGAPPVDLTRSNSSSTRNNFSSTGHDNLSQLSDYFHALMDPGQRSKTVPTAPSSSNNFSSTMQDSLSDYFHALMDPAQRSRTVPTAPDSSRNSIGNQTPNTDSDAASSRSSNAGQLTSSSRVPYRSQSQREGSSNTRQLASSSYVPYRSQSHREGKFNTNSTLSNRGSNREGGPHRRYGSGLAEVRTRDMYDGNVGHDRCNRGRGRVHEDWCDDRDVDSESVSDLEEQLRSAGDRLQRAETKLRHHLEKRSGRA